MTPVQRRNAERRAHREAMRLAAQQNAAVQAAQPEPAPMPAPEAAPVFQLVAEPAPATFDLSVLTRQLGDGAGFILDLMYVTPENPTVRALVLKNTGLWIPEELKTYHDMGNWLQAQLPKPPDPAQPIMLTVKVTGRETGRCRFTQDVTGDVPVQLDPQTLIDLASASDTAAGLLNRIVRELKSQTYDADNLDRTIDPDGYESHDDAEVEEWSLAFNESATLAAVKEIIRTGNPAAYERLFGGNDDLVF